MTGILDYLFAQTFDSLLLMFWFLVVFEIPRYFLLFALTVLMPRWRPDVVPDDLPQVVSVVVVGHSESDKIETCVRALHEQSRVPDEIIVLSDGSTDDMARRIADLQRSGLVTAAHATQLRSGKAAGLNLGTSLTSGDIVVIVDCDCSFDRHAIRDILHPFADPAVGAVAGSVLVRNGDASLLAAFQSIEYNVTISLGKQAADRLGLVSCVSGAFGAFRQTALDSVGGFDAGSGEDLDLTLSLRTAGWSVRFAEDAVCYTDVPTTWRVLIKQRFRWERDAIHLRYRKHASLMNPASPRFRWGELAHELEFFLFNVVAAVALPIYFGWLWFAFGDLAPFILAGAQIGLIGLDSLVFLLAAMVTPHAARTQWPFIFGFSIYYGLFMRGLRLCAYVDEWIFRSSYRDPFVPPKVNKVRG
ncbi:glycosyltransferase family 2 protein [Loktanella sp. M215]|uniref:glycosyltransferase family 2 protein n=1 Tax=Loktanella sp. M215 TaxID=2675431 RepID=UPI001F339C17|nr:glycosyltransferase [Loktanella sp. M215]